MLPIRQERSADEKIEGLPTWASTMNPTPQQLAVLRLLALGATNPEIGRALWLSPDTVKNHVARIGDLVGSRNRTRIVVEAIARGWLLHPTGQGESLRIRPMTVKKVTGRPTNLQRRALEQTWDEGCA
jgi:DNA-binding CsgD family transcriptional regulator